MKGVTQTARVCPLCDEPGVGTIHDDLYYCMDDDDLDKFDMPEEWTGCGELFDPTPHRPLESVEYERRADA